MFTPAGELSWEGSRLLALSATLSGTVREITANLQKIAAAPWTPAVPVMLGSPATRAVPPSTADLDWSAIVDSDLWASPRDFKSGLAAFDAKGWSGLRKDGTWTTGTGIGLRWQSGPEFVAPDRRSLSALGRELYYEKVYRDEHIDNILAANAPLGRSLEGRLFSLGWIPVGAAFGPADRTPLAMTGVPSIGNLLTQPKHNLQGEALKAIEPFKSLKSVESCRFAEATPEESIARVVADGVSMLGRSGVSSQISRSTNPQLKAGAAVVVRCTNARGIPLRLLVLRTAMLDSDEGRARARAGEKIDASANALVFAPTTDASWPVGIQSDIIVAVGLDQPIAASVRTAFLRSWLDDVFRFGRVDRVLIRVSFLEMVIAATASWQPRAESFAKVRMVPAERVSGEARSAAVDPACTTEEALLDQQKLFHALLKLNGIPSANRAVDVPIIGIVESSVMRSIPIFKRADGRSVWVFLNEGRFVIFEDDDPVPIDARSLHGTRVAGLVFSASPPTGVLSDARLTWVDESEPSATVLSKLAGNNDIVNFSRSLHGGWSSLLQTAARFWTPALFVAAAHNKNEGATLTPEQDQQENDDGMPISWHLPNIVGVGVADAEGKTSEKVLTSYLREQVDLLAPGYMVPAVGPVPEKPTCLDGTSYAAAYVSAVAALVQQRGHGMLTASQLRARLLATASWKPEYWEHVKGGLVDAGLRSTDCSRTC